MKLRITYIYPSLIESLGSLTAILCYHLVFHASPQLMILPMILFCLYLQQTGINRYRLLVLLLIIFTASSLTQDTGHILVPEEHTLPSSVSGIVTEDLRAVRGGSYMGACSITSMERKNGLIIQEGTFGRVSILVRSGDRLLSGELFHAEVTGIWEGYLLLKGLTPLEDQSSHLSVLRGILVRGISERIDLLPHTAGELCRMLVLGYREDADLPLVRTLTAAGVRHFIALSGMHLFLIAVAVRSVFTRLFGKKTAGFLTVLIISCYLFIAGPRPSLVRAGILFFSGYLLRERTIHERLLLTWLVHLYLFPNHVQELGFLLSYAAIHGIITLTPMMEYPAGNRILRGIISLLYASVAAMIYTLPLQLEHFGRWTAAVIPATLVMSPLIVCYMGMSFLFLCIPASGTLIIPVCGLIETVSRWFASIPAIRMEDFSFLPYTMTFLLLTAIRHLFIYGRICHNRRREEAYEQDISLRFTETDTGITD